MSCHFVSCHPVFPCVSVLLACVSLLSLILFHVTSFSFILSQFSSSHLVSFAVASFCVLRHFFMYPVRFLHFRVVIISCASFLFIPSHSIWFHWISCMPSLMSYHPARSTLITFSQSSWQWRHDRASAYSLCRYSQFPSMKLPPRPIRVSFVCHVVPWQVVVTWEVAKILCLTWVRAPPPKEQWWN